MILKLLRKLFIKNYKDLEKGTISLTASILNRNIYEYLEKNDIYGSLYNEFKYQRDSKNEDYSKFKESLTKIIDKTHEKYLYKATYNYKGYSDTIKYENYYIIYEIDKNHILIFKVESTNNKIPKELLDKIKFVEAINYSSNITSEIKSDRLVSVMKRFTDYTKTKYEEYTIKLPTNYKEIDNKLNVYTNKYFGINYDSENDIYQYNIKYSLSATYMTIDKIVSNVLIYKNIGYYQEMTSHGKITLHGKEFEIYSGGYTDYGAGYRKNSDDETHYVYKKLLGYKLENGGYLVIEIDSNSEEITEQLLNDLTDIDIMIKEYK